jgi:hypothetical protein
MTDNCRDNALGAYGIGARYAGEIWSKEIFVPSRDSAASTTKPGQCHDRTLHLLGCQRSASSTS